MITSRNKISLTKVVLTAVVSAMLAIIPLQQSTAHNAVDGTNLELVGDTNGSLFVATTLASTAVAHTAVTTATGASVARSTGLYYKSVAYASGTAQTATVVAGGLLSLYASVSTTSAISTDNGNIYGVGATNSMVQTSTATGVAFTMPLAAAGTATPIAVIYQAPATAGTAVISLTIGRLTAATIPVATNGLFLQGDEYTTITVTILPATNLSTSHFTANSTSNHAVVSGPVNASLLVATQSNTGGSAVAPSTANPITGTAITSAARSSGLLAKSSTMATAQTATILSGGKLSLYANISTSVAFTSSGGSFASTTQGSSAGVVTYSDPASTSLVVLTSAQSALGATAVGTLWTAPTTAGTYTVSLYKHSGTTEPTLASPSSGTLAAQITVTVTAATAGGAYSAAYSACYTKTTATGGVAAGTITADSTSSFLTNGSSWYIGFALKDAYNADLAAGNLIVTSTGGGIVNIGADAGALAAGTATTAVLAASGSAHQVRVDQPTAGAPLTTTITITYNGTTVCTKTVKIAGVASTVTVSKVATGDLSSTTVNADWLSDPAGVGTGGARSGHYYVQLKDSAGNIVTPASASEFSMDPATTTTTVTAMAVNAFVATSTSSTSTYSSSVGTFTCGPVAGSSDVKLRHTSAATGVTISSPAFTARCADNPYTYTVSLDKASYSQGEIGTMTVSFLDSKGFKANSVIAVGGASMIMPMLTLVTATGSATALTDANGEIKYTFTVGTTSGMTAGTYSGIVDFTALTAVAAVKATPTYKLSSATSDVAFSEILKSVVALIASINKQIQALQKLILKR
jgi:hypothetical protein